MRMGTVFEYLVSFEGRGIKLKAHVRVCQFTITNPMPTFVTSLATPLPYTFRVKHAGSWSWFALTPKLTFLHPLNMSKTSTFFCVLAVSNGLRPKFYVRM